MELRMVEGMRGLWLPESVANKSGTQLWPKCGRCGTAVRGGYKIVDVGRRHVDIAAWCHGVTEEQAEVRRVSKPSHWQWWHCERSIAMLRYYDGTPALEQRAGRPRFSEPDAVDVLNTAVEPGSIPAALPEEWFHGK
jgi:hypothetical protein